MIDYGKERLESKVFYNKCMQRGEVDVVLVKFFREITKLFIIMIRAHGAVSTIHYREA